VRKDLPGWKEVIDHSVRQANNGAYRDLAFGADSFIVPVGDLKVFRSRQDTAFIHLGHSVVKHGLQKLVRARYPGKEKISRWTTRRGPVPAGSEALILLSVEELGSNQLRETFHHWVRTVAFPIQGGKLGELLEAVPAVRWSEGLTSPSARDEEIAADLLADLQRDIEQWLKKHRDVLEAELIAQLAKDNQSVKDEETKRFQSRAGELSELIEGRSRERKRQQLQTEMAQPMLFSADENRRLKVIAELEEEISRRDKHLEEIRDVLEKERDRVLNKIIPDRFALGSSLAVFPVSVEVRLPAGGVQ
jgi:hypothetical protein